MSDTSLATALDRQSTPPINLETKLSLPDTHAASTALSQQANEIGMTGVLGGAERLGLMAAQGVVDTKQGIVETIKTEGVTGLLTTAAESTVIGAGLRFVMTKSEPIAAAAAIGMGVMFIGENAPKFLNAGSKALNAHTWSDMDDASATFGKATGALVVDSAIGYGGFKLGSGVMGLTPWAKMDPLPTAAAAETTETSSAPAASVADITAHLGDRPLKPLALGQGLGALEENSAGLGLPPEAAVKALDNATEVDKASDAPPMVKKAIDASMTISMRELSERDPQQFNQVLDDYYAKLQKAFPDASEIESKETYHDYLHDKDFPWDMLVLRDKEGTVLGGIQSQEVEVNGQELKKAIWAEHIWLDPEARTYTNFRNLIKTGAEKWSATGSDVVFMEFNDRAKMTLQQQNDDAAAGLTPEAREKIWGRVGLYVLGDENGKIAPYSQPAMGDGDPVTYLSVGMASLKSPNLDGQSIPVDDYLKLLRAAHSTIPDLDLDTDPTIRNYTSVLDDIKASGQDRLSFARLSDTEVLRLVNSRVVPTKPNAGADQSGQ